MPIEHIFLDDGGVLNDNSLRAPQWQRLVGEFFAPKLGGTPEAWAEVNGRVAEGVFLRTFARLALWNEEPGDFVEEINLYNVDWLRTICEGVGVDGPAAYDDALALASEATAYIMTRVNAAQPGAAEAVKALASRFDVCNASGSMSHELLCTLSGMGIEGCIRRRYGPDLINYPKIGARYYELLLADARAEPSRSLVVDDKTESLDWARAAGANVVLVAPRPVDRYVTVPRLADLPALLENGLLLE